MTSHSHQLPLFSQEVEADASPETGGRIKVATWNVNGIRARESQLVEWMAREMPDVVCLQEIKANPSQIPPALCALAGYDCYWHGERGYSGVALHVRRSAFASVPRFVHADFDFENRIVSATMDGLTVSSVYVPNGGKDLEAKMRFLDELTLFVERERAAGHALIVCGDLNVARTEMDVHPKERRPNKSIIGQLPEERARFERLLAHGMVDVARAQAPQDERLFTWWPPWREMRQRNIGWRIDYILASEELASTVVECAVRADVGTSDHAPVVAVFKTRA